MCYTYVATRALPTVTGAFMLRGKLFMVIKKRNSPVYKGYACVISILGFLLSFWCWGKGDKNSALFMMCLFSCTFLGFICLCIESRYMFVLDEAGIQFFSKQKMQKQYAWSELTVVYHSNTSLSKEQIKDLKQNNMPLNPHIMISHHTSNSHSKLIADIYLLEDNECLFGRYTANKKEFFTQMQNWNISFSQD